MLAAKPDSLTSRRPFYARLLFATKQLPRSAARAAFGAAPRTGYPAKMLYLALRDSLYIRAAVSWNQVDKRPMPRSRIAATCNTTRVTLVSHEAASDIFRWWPVAGLGITNRLCEDARTSGIFLSMSSELAGVCALLKHTEPSDVYRFLVPARYDALSAPDGVQRRVKQLDKRRVNRRLPMLFNPFSLAVDKLLRLKQRELVFESSQFSHLTRS